MMTGNKNSTTKIDEANRKRDTITSRSYISKTRKYGRIQAVDAQHYTVTVALEDGGMAANGNFIPVKNAWQQIIHDFGELRQGLLVEIVYEGDQDMYPEALVIALENETIAEVQQAPTVDLGLYEIFAPGS